MADSKQVGIFRLRVYDETSSTNDVIKQEIDAGEPEGLAVGALVQTAGYGRLGRSWESPKGGMYVSCLLRPCMSVCKLPSLSLVVALAVRRALEEFLSTSTLQSVKIKWPNDIIYCSVADTTTEQYEAPQRCPLSLPGSEDLAALPDPNNYFKLCGISLEVHNGAVCIGIGVNVFSPHEAQNQFPDAKNTPAYLSDLAQENTPIDSHETLDVISVERVRTAVLSSLTCAYELWQSSGFTAFLPEYEACSYLTGMYVSLENIDGSHITEGTVQGINEQGALMVLPNSAQKPLAISSGEAHINRISYG